METALQKLSKILELEAQGGYRNQAVIGGIQRYVPVWITDAREQASAESEKALVEQVGELLMDYGSLSGVSARADLIGSIQERLSAMAEAAADPPEKERLVTAPDPAPEPGPTVDQAKSEPAVQSPEEKRQPEQRVEPERPQSVPAGLSASIEKVRGVGPRTAGQLQKLGIETIRDLITFYPRRYIDYRSLKPISHLTYGEQVTIVGTVWETKSQRARTGRKVVHSIIGDGTATIQCTWFNQPWLVNKLKAGATVMVSGKVNQYLGRLVFQSPEWELVEKEHLHTGRIVPIYPLTSGLSAKVMRSHVKRAVDYWARRTPDPISAEALSLYDLMNLETALLQIHFPNTWDRLEAARRRLVFDELLVVQLGMLRQRHQWQSKPGLALPADDECVQGLLRRLPYELTSAQSRALAAIRKDMAQSLPMNRLLQGDVGSGKTVVAAAAMHIAVGQDAQAALMAPTEILAEQHFRNLSALLDQARVRLLTGSVPAQEKKQIYDALADGEIDVVVGTHALIQEGVGFHNLGLVIVDEQHRFGVAQRAELRQKGYNPHMLVMTATPIPRSLALTLYGDLDVTLIDEMPPGRQQVETRWLEPVSRERAYRFLRAECQAGRQAFIICPLVEASDKSEAKAAVDEHKRLEEQVFPDLRLGLLHGRMKSEDKEAAMSAFYHGETDILVSTSVVEVGIDVPNATIMLVEGANRFGLAQLHQFRGRVGRGEHQSYCILLADSPTPEATERLNALVATNDGFVLAEKDLELRGPGEFFGTRQSGLPDLKLAGVTDIKTLECAREEAERIHAQDPMLETPGYRLLAREVEWFWADKGEMS